MVLPDLRLGIVPNGTLLEFSADLSTDFGFAYERFLHFQKDSHSHERFVFCAARGGCRFEVTELATGKTYWNSSKSSVFKAPNSTHSLICRQTVYENLVFLPTKDRLHEAFKRAEFADPQWSLLMDGLRELNRSEWFDALVERYFNRKVFRPDDRESLKTIENELLREVLVMALGEPKQGHQKGIKAEWEGHESPVRRAIEKIELSLFEKLDLESLAKSVAVSRSTLQRQFKSEVGVSPIEYVRKRKLEEAKRLLEKGNHSVSEVSLLVGYEDLSAFSRAYKREYGVAPST